MSDKMMRKALVAAYIAGNQHGHNSTVEGYWSEAEDVAEEYADEALAQQPAETPKCKTCNGEQAVINGTQIDTLGARVPLVFPCPHCAQQPAAVVELTKCEGCNGHGEVGGLLPGDGGYESNPCPFCQPVAVELTDYELNDISMLKTGYPITVLGRVLARAVIAAHIAKQGGAA